MKHMGMAIWTTPPPHTHPQNRLWLILQGNKGLMYDTQLYTFINNIIIINSNLLQYNLLQVRGVGISLCKRKFDEYSKSQQRLEVLTNFF